MRLSGNDAERRFYGGVVQTIAFAYGFSIAGLVDILAMGFFYLLIKDFSDKDTSRFLKSTDSGGR